MKRILRFAICAALCLALLLADMCVIPAAESFYPSADLLLIKNHIENDANHGAYSTVQGACTDGEYAYFALMNGGATIMKYDIKSWELVECKRISNVGHANDMTYNPDKGYIVIANNAPYYDLVTLLDPDTLEVIKDVELDEEIYSIAYNQKRKQYVVGISGCYDFALLDSDFKKVKDKKFEGEDTGYTRQGCDCDDDYIYFVQSGNDNALVIYDYSGKNVGMLPLGDTDEVENIFHLGDTFYVTMYYYGNYVHRIGFSPRTAITYNITYDANGGEGQMEDTVVSYGKATNLRANSFTRPGYFFGGWRVQRDSDGRYVGYRVGEDEFGWLYEDEVNDYLLYNDGQAVATTVRYGNVDLRAFWISETYGVNFEAGMGEGYMEPLRVGYDEVYTIPESNFTCEGYVFDGYMAVRDCDGRVYALREGSDTPEWLRWENVYEVYHLKPGEQVSRMAFDGAVTLTAEFRFAYTFGDDGSTLVEYVGTDEKVTIPGNNGELTTLAEGAFKDNEIITELHIPPCVSSIQPNSVTNCPKLRNIYFEGSIPEDFGKDTVTGAASPIVYRMVDDVPMCVGFLSSPECAQIIQMQSAALEGATRTRTELNNAGKELKKLFK